MTEVITKKLSLPQNLLVYAIIETLLVIIVVLLAGFLINLFNTVVTNVLAGIIGQVPAFIIRNYLTYPGTVHHEFSHALVAFLTGAKVLRINLFPRGNALGSVELEPRGNLVLRSLQLSLSAIAPVVLGVTSLVLLMRFILNNLVEVWHYILFWYFFISILLHMSMSSADYANFFKGFLPSALIMFLIFLILGSVGIVF